MEGLLRGQNDLHEGQGPHKGGTDVVGVTDLRNPGRSRRQYPRSDGITSSKCQNDISRDPSPFGQLRRDDI